MSPRDIAVAVIAAALLAASASAVRAERLGGAYRGPKVEQSSVRTDGTDDASQTGDQNTSEPGDSAGSGTNDAGTAGGESGSGSGDDIDTRPGGQESTGSGHGGSGSYRGPAGDTPPPSGREGGSSDANDGSRPQTGGNAPEGSGSGAASGSAGGASGGGGSPADGGGSTPTVGRKASNHGERAFQRVLWYFEQNREALLFDVTARAKRDVAPRPGSPADVLGFGKSSPRIRTPLSGDDRAQVFRTLEAHASVDTGAAARDAAAIALGKLGTPEAVEVLLDRFALEPDLEVRQDILLALGMSRSPAALPVL
jgi:hypothetical protein